MLPPQAGDFALLESFDGFAAFRNGLARLATDRKEWAGLPMPLEGSPLVIEPRFPRSAAIMEIGRDPSKGDGGIEGATIRNTFWSWQRRSHVTIWEVDGKLDWGVLPATNQAALLMRTLGAADAWGIEQEHRAIQTLGTLVRHRQFKQYLLTGMLMERSPRSGVHYLFRRLRPTVAIRERADGSLRILCTLCMHPIGYYEGSWAGAMTPTDDLLAHLMLMRGDEHMLWRRANQHPAWARESGL